MLVHTDEGVTGISSGGDGLPDRALLERLLVGRDPLRTECIREICETVDFHGGRPWAVEIAVWDLVGKIAGPAAVAAARRPLRAARRLRVERRAARAGRARRAVPGTGRAGRQGGQAPLPPRRLARRRRRDRRGARGGRRPARDHGRRQPGLADARRPRRALGRGDGGAVRAGARGARDLLARGAAAHRRRGRLREPARAHDPPYRGGRDGAERGRGPRPRRPRARSTCSSATCSSSAASAAPAAWPRSPICTAAPGRRTRGRTASAWSRTSTPRSRSRPCPTSRFRTTRRPGRTSAATGCCPSRCGSRPTGRSRRRPGPGLGVELDLAALERWRDRLMEIAAVVLRSPGRPVAVEQVELAGPKAGEVLVRVAAAGVCHSDVRLADGELGDGRWPMVLGHEGAGVVAEVGDGVEHVVPGDHVAFSFVPACGSLPRVPRRAAEPVRAGGRRGLRGHAARRHEPPVAARRHRAAARPDDRLFRRRDRGRGRLRGADRRAGCRCGRRRCSAAASSPGPAPCGTSRASRRATPSA